jgi:hypothetical protein
MLPINGLTSVIRVNAKNASFHKKIFKAQRTQAQLFKITNTVMVNA